MSENRLPRSARRWLSEISLRAVCATSSFLVRSARCRASCSCRRTSDLREARGVTLLRQWLSPEQKAQFDASKCFDVVGCDSGRRYRISHGTGTNVHEIDDPAGRSRAGVLSHQDT